MSRIFYIFQVKAHRIPVSVQREEAKAPACLDRFFTVGVQYFHTSPLREMEADMKQCMDAQHLHRRLIKIIGQVQAIDRMIDEDIPCEDVLSQLNAAKSALHRCGQVVLEGHIRHCVKDGLEHGDADKTIEEFTKAVERFANMG